jgi:hypothetical protein
MKMKCTDMMAVRNLYRLVVENGGSRPVNGEALSDSWPSVIYDVVGI